MMKNIVIVLSIAVAALVISVAVQEIQIYKISDLEKFKAQSMIYTDRQGALIQILLLAACKQDQKCVDQIVARVVDQIK